MAALDFPNAPTVGNTYTGPNGVVYTWDGAAWTVSGVLSTGTAAGGSLAGTYPNPTIAASAVRGTPSSGGTAREIQKASIWGGDDLIDLSIPTAKHADGSVTGPKLSVGAATHGFWTGAFPLNFTVSAGAWTSVASVAVSPRGGLILVWILPSISVAPGTGTTNRVVTMLTRDNTMALGGAQLGSFTQFYAAAANTRLPAPGVLFTDTPTAAAHGYYINYYIDTGTMVTSADFPGSINALEFS